MDLLLIKSSIQVGEKDLFECNLIVDYQILELECIL